MAAMTQILPDTEHFDFNRQRLQQEAMMGIHMLMEDQDLTKSGLADRLGGKKKRPLVSKFLSGTHNFRLDTLADIFALLGAALHLRFTENIAGFELPKDERRRHQTNEAHPAFSGATDVIASFERNDGTEFSGLENVKKEETDPSKVEIVRSAKSA